MLLQPIQFLNIIKFTSAASILTVLVSFLGRPLGFLVMTLLAIELRLSLTFGPLFFFGAVSEVAAISTLHSSLTIGAASPSIEVNYFFGLTFLALDDFAT